EPAKMVSLPEISSLPPPETVVEKPQKLDRQSKKELLKERASAKKIADVPVAAKSVEAPAAAAAQPAVQAPVTPIVGARFAQQKKSKTGLYAMLGVGLAAAAGVAFYVTTMSNASDQASAKQVAMQDTGHG